MLVGVIEEGCDLVLLPRVERAGDNRAAGRFNVLHQRLEFGAVAAACEHGEPLGGKFLGDLGADKVAGADHRDGSVSLLHSMCSNLVIARGKATKQSISDQQATWIASLRSQ
jgi:hypothetical protein